MEELLKIQSELKAPKGQYNSFGKYRYRSQEDILEAVKPLLAKAGCTLTLTDEIIPVGGRVYVKATCTLTGKGGQSVTTTAYAREAETKPGMDVAQVTGAASSYARKYALNGLFCIDDTKDADTDELHKQQAAAKPAPVQAAPAVPPETLAVALQEVRAARGKSSLEEIFPRYPMLQRNDAFRTEYRNRMNTLKEQGLWKEDA